MRLALTGFVLLSLILSTYLVRETGLGTFEAVDGVFMDWLNTSTRSTPAESHLVLAEIDDESLKTTGAWPWSPLEYSLFLETVTPSQPAVVAIEPVLFWDPPQREFLDALLTRVIRLPKLVLGSELGTAEFATETPVLDLPVLRKVSGDKSHLEDFPEVLRQPSEELRLASVRGFVNLPDAGPTVRRVPMLFRCRGEVVPSFALQCLMLHFQLTASEVQVRLGESIRMGEKLAIPIDAGGSMLVNFRSLESVKRIPYDDLLFASEEARSGSATAPKPPVSSDSIVLLGRTDRSMTRLPMADGKLASPVVLIAAAIATVEEGRFLRKPPAIWSFAIAGVMTVLSVFLLSRRRGNFLVLTLLIPPVYALTALWIFERTSTAVPLVLPVSILLLAVVFRLAMRTPAAK